VLRLLRPRPGPAFLCHHRRSRHLTLEPPRYF